MPPLSASRKKLLTCDSYQLTLTFGLLLAAIVNNATHNRQDTGSYRIPVVIQALWAVILAGGLLYLPETPRYFVKTGNIEKAAHSLGRLRQLPSDHESVKEELDEIIANHEFELSLGKSNWMSIIKKAGSQRKRLFTGCMIMAGSQLTGINFIFYYGTQFFKNSGISNPFLIGLTTNLVNVFSTLPGLYLVEKWGRRPILLFGAIGMCVCEFIVAIVGVTASSEVANKVLIAFVCFYIFFFACSWGPVGWVVVVSITSVFRERVALTIFAYRARSSLSVSAPNLLHALLPVTGSSTGPSAFPPPISWIPPLVRLAWGLKFSSSGAPAASSAFYSCTSSYMKRRDLLSSR